MTAHDPFAGCATAEDAIAALHQSGAEEVRPGIFDTDANPYLAHAACLASGLADLDVRRYFEVM